MAWDFQTEPEFQEKLDWVERFCKEELEPLHFVFPYAVRSPDPKVKALVVPELNLGQVALEVERCAAGQSPAALGRQNPNRREPALAFRMSRFATVGSLTLTLSWCYLLNSLLL